MPLDTEKMGKCESVSIKLIKKKKFQLYIIKLIKLLLPYESTWIQRRQPFWIIFTMQVRESPINKSKLLPVLGVKWNSILEGSHWLMEATLPLRGRLQCTISGVLGPGLFSCMLKYLPHLLHCCLKHHMEHFIPLFIVSFSQINMKLSLKRKYIIAILAWSYFTISWGQDLVGK